MSTVSTGPIAIVVLREIRALLVMAAAPCTFLFILFNLVRGRV